MMQRIARHPRIEKLRDWRRNRFGGARHSGSGRDREQNPGGRPWEGRGSWEMKRQKGLCTNRGCDALAVATVPGYPIPLPKCFEHEREYVDRYGPEGVRPL